MKTTNGGLESFVGARRAPVRVFASALLISGATAVVSSMGCTPPSAFPTVVPDDAGDRSWARQVIPIVLGRKAKGAMEVKLIADMVAATDRPTVLRGLMRGPEFTEHWSETLVNSMRVDREITNFSELDQSDCYGAPLRSAAPSSALAQYILDNSPSAAVPAGGAFNMSDVVSSAVVLDNLAPLYKAHLFALEHHQAPFAGQQARDDLGTRFAEVFLGRQNTCLQCHNSDSSTTGAGSGWNRFFPILGSFEQGLYGASIGGDPVNIHEMFRLDQQGVGAGFNAPWGMTGCGMFKADMGSSNGGNPYFTGPLPAGATVTTIANRFKAGYDGLAAHGLNRAVPPAVQSACTTCQTSCSGTTPLDPEAVTNGTFVRDLLTAHAAAGDCGGCHGGTQGLWFWDPAPPAGEHWYSHLINIPSSEDTTQIRVLPGDADHSWLVKKLLGTASVGSRMPQGAPALSAATIQKVKDWINALPPAGTSCTNCPTLNCDKTYINDPKEGFAYLVAARIVNTVWQEAMGYPLTIANYFPRNAGQRGALWNLTEATFIPSGWSLQELLVRILTADTFNRRAPDIQGPSGTPYLEPELYDPWVQPDPRTPPANQSGWSPSAHPDLYDNAMTDGVYRYSAWNLLRSVQKAMDWPGPRRFPTTAYPSDQLERDIGQYFSVYSPGFKVTNFPALLSWEKDHGQCANHNPGSAPDWIDRLVIASAAFSPPASDPTPLVLRDLAKVERDWLLGNGTLAATSPAPLTQTEEQALAGIMGPLDTNVSTLTAADLGSRLRAVCGLMLEAPQFFLAGVASDDPGDVPRLRTCNGSPCSYLEMCHDLTAHTPLPSGNIWTCGSNSVATLDLGAILAQTGAERAFCPWCPVVSIDPGGCFDPEATVCNATPPACDARCNRIDCCGGPLQRVDRAGSILLWGDGTTVQEAAGVRVRRAVTGKVGPLAAKDTLAYGDVVELTPGGRLILDDAGKTLKYEPKGQTGLRTRYVLITGPKALSIVERKTAPPPTSKGQMQWLRTQGWRRSPDGSTPTVITPEMRAPGQAEKQWQAQIKRMKAQRSKP